MNKNQKLILYICTFLTFLFLVLSISLEPIHYRFKKYEDLDDVAAYIYKYNSLPRNYIKKIQGITNAEVSEKLADGYSFGGDVFRYEGPITNYTDNINLREADYYKDREERIEQGNRGTCRFVYTIRGKKQIFYTEDHYDTFIELNVSKRFIPSMIMKIFLYISYSGVVLIIIQHQISLNRRKKRERENN